MLRRVVLAAGFAPWLLLASACATGTVGSIGAVLGRDGDSGAVFVRETPEGNAGERAGLRPGDEIVFVDGRDVRDLDVEHLRKVLRGDPGSHVSLTVLRGGEVVRLRVERAPLHALVPKKPDAEEKLSE